MHKNKLTEVYKIKIDTWHQIRLQLKVNLDLVWFPLYYESMTLI